MKKQRKTIRLIAGSEEGKGWNLQIEVYPASFLFLGLFVFHSNKRNQMRRIRSKDRNFFIYHVGNEYMKGKEIHHDWNNGATCYLLEREKHKELHKWII